MDGILLIDKPILWTSHDVVDFVRVRAGQRRVGHAGTLDPMATGLLILLLGHSTKKAQELSAQDKGYRGTLRLGMSTDTLDMEGRIVKESSYEGIEQKKLEDLFLGMTGTIMQRPPDYSAARVQGKKLYQYSRKGVLVEPPLKEVTVKKFVLEGFYPPEIQFSMDCSKGTYVRSVCEEVGRRLGCGAVLSSLIRTRVGRYGLDRALSVDRMKALTPQELDERLLSDSA